MNVHFYRVNLPLKEIRMTAALIESGPKQRDRREHILEAAEACFVRNGFHQTSMQDLAKEARMSAGNIYRYFVSKEAVIAAIADREREEGARLAEQFEKAGGKRAAFEGVIREYFLDVTREKAILRLDLWSEATRDPNIAALLESSEASARKWFINTIREIATSPKCDGPSLYAALHFFLRGILVSRALAPQQNDPASAKWLWELIDASLKGKLMARASS